VTHGAPIRIVGVVPNSAWVTTASDDGDVRLWDASSGVVLGDIRTGADITAVAWTPDGNRLATRTRDRVTVWDATGAERAQLHAGPRAPRALAIAPNDDGDLVVWDVAAGVPVAVLDPHRSDVSAVAFSPDGALVASASQETARIDDAATGHTLAYLDRTLGYDPAASVAFDRSGDRLVVSGVDTFARVWDVSRDDRPSAEILKDVACRGGFELDGSVVRPVVTTERCGIGPVAAH
jgi:WD40 repeat protein